MREISKWKEIGKGTGHYVLDNGKGRVYLSYQPNDFGKEAGDFWMPNLDSSNPETAVVLINDKLVESLGVVNRYLIFRGDKRKKLEALYPNIAKLKAYWKKEGGHFWSDSLDEDRVSKSKA